MNGMNRFDVQRARRGLFVFLSLLIAPATLAEQYVKFGGVNVHYVVVNTAFLQPEIAANYDIVRAKDRALVNLSLIGPDGVSQTADLKGKATNLLGQQQPLEFRLIQEGDARYYIATLRYTDRDTLRFSIEVAQGDSLLGTLKFQQTMYWGEE